MAWSVRTSSPGERVAAFDLDHTLLKPKNKRKFPKDRDDAELVYPQICEKLQILHSKGWKIVIFTNQKGIGKHTTIDDIYYKVDTFLPNGSEIDVYISYGDDKYRKPLPGLLEEFMKNNGYITDIFYVGDAAGRANDFSASDRKFAYNYKLPFYTPEQFFLDRKEELPLISLVKPPRPKGKNLSIPEKTVVLLIGPPACGKSTLAKQLAEKYEDTVIVNNDTLGPTGAFNRFKTVIRVAPRIIVDNTNAKLINRAMYTEMAKDNDYKVYAVVFNLDKSVLEHLNSYRAYMNDVPRIPAVAYHTFNKYYEPVKKSEKYNECIEYVPKFPKSIFAWSF